MHGEAAASYCTVNAVALVAVPPGVAIDILPVTAPVGTVAVTCVSELTVNTVAVTAPNFTRAVCERLMPVITTCVPTGPEVGLKLVMLGAILNFNGVSKLPEDSLTVI
jgi:hypothetical protein